MNARTSRLLRHYSALITADAVRQGRPPPAHVLRTLQRAWSRMNRFERAALRTVLLHRTEAARRPRVEPGTAKP